MEPVLDKLRSRLRAAGSARWEQIAREAGVAKTLPRKIACGERRNPGIRTIQPLLDYFERLDQARLSAADALALAEGAPPVPQTTEEVA